MKRSDLKYLALILLAVWGLLHLLIVGKAAPPAPEPVRAHATAPVVAPGERVMTSDHFGCVDAKMYKDAWMLMGDEAAFVERMARIGRYCDTFDKGDAVIVTDVGIMSGLVKVRKPGKSTGYWMTHAAVGS